MLAAYAQNSDAYREAHAAFGDSEDLLRRAASAIEQAGTNDRGKGQGLAGDDEVKALISFARRYGLLLDSASLQAFMASHAMRSGSEHKVARREAENRVIKDLDTEAIATESLFDYLTDHLFANYFFNDAVRLEGFYEHLGRLHIVISQPYVDGIHPVWDELKIGLKAQGLVHEKPQSKTPSFVIEATPAGAIYINDLHENNVIRGSFSGLFHPIDAHFYFDTRAERIAALRELGIWPTNLGRD